MFCMDDVLYYISAIVSAIIVRVLLIVAFLGLAKVNKEINKETDELYSIPLTDEERERRNSPEYLEAQRIDQEMERMQEERKHREKMEEMERQRLKMEEERTSYERYLAKKAHDDSIRHEGYDWTGGGDYKL